MLCFPQRLALRKLHQSILCNAPHPQSSRLLAGCAHGQCTVLPCSGHLLQTTGAPRSSVSLGTGCICPWTDLTFGASPEAEALGSQMFCACR